MDQKIRFESAFRTIFLYPFALSFIVTGHVWAWIMNPTYGLQGAMRNLGWAGFTFDWLSNKDMVVFTLVIAGLWQGTGLTMALMLAGLRSIDDEVWKAARVDGIPMWRTYISIVIPMMRPVLVTTFVLSASGIVRIYDLVVALTQGGPGLFSEMPATYVMSNLFGGNLAQGLAASSVMLVITAIVFALGDRRVRPRQRGTGWAEGELGRRQAYCVGASACVVVVSGADGRASLLGSAGGSLDEAAAFGGGGISELCLQSSSQIS
jgi:ABC-type sugar transport system permease subunit